MSGHWHTLLCFSEWDRDEPGPFNFDARIKVRRHPFARMQQISSPRRRIDPHQPAVESIHETTDASFAERRKTREIMRLRMGETEKRQPITQASPLTLLVCLRRDSAADVAR